MKTPKEIKLKIVFINFLNGFIPMNMLANSPFLSLVVFLGEGLNRKIKKADSSIPGVIKK